MWEYHIDEFVYIPYKKISINGWLLGKGTIKLLLDGNEVEIFRKFERQDVYKFFNITNECFKVGFQEEIEINTRINKIEIVAYDNENKMQLISYTEHDLLNYIPQDTLLFCIDSVELFNNDVIINGWAFSKYYSDVDIMVENVKVFEVNKHERVDVIRANGNLDTTEKCGFEIICKNHKISKKVNIIIKDKCSQRYIILGKKDITNKNDDVFDYLLNNLTWSNFKKGIIYIKKYGCKNLISKIKRKTINNKSLYNQWLIKNTPKSSDLNDQKEHRFDYQPLISILVPTYNTPEKFLKEMIESVRNQTYSNWEICIADGSDNKDTKRILNDYSVKFKNINVNYLDKNEGISGNSNRALEMAVGEYIALFDHDDLLTPNALYEIVKAINENNKPDFIYTDEDKVDENGNNFFDPHFKPDWSPDTLRSYNYITHFSVFKSSLLEKTGKFRSEFDGSQDYDLILRLTEISKNIVHIPKVLYHWRVHKNSTASGLSAKPYTYIAAQNAIKEHLKRCKLNGFVEDGLLEGTHRVKYEIQNEPLISIIIPNKDHREDLEKCINSIIEKTTYKNYEIVIIENNSETDEILDYYEKIKAYKNLKVINWENEFNYAAINNFGVKHANGEYILLLNNDIEIISEDWIQEMLMFAQRKDVGIVGAKLYYPDNTIQHAGVILGIGGVAGHSHKYFNKLDGGYFSRTKIVQNLSAVTAACLMIRKEVFNEVKGLDEGFKVAFNDVDLCMKVREAGYLIVFTPYAEMYHYESKSRGAEDSEDKKKRFENEVNRFKHKWGLFLEDPYYNKNLTLEKEDFSIKISL